MEMEFKITETNRGNKALICDGHSYRYHTMLKNGELSWRCCNKTCKVRLCTDSESSYIVRIKNSHIHEGDDRKMERQELRISAKRKAADEPTSRPSKIIRKELTAMDEKNLHQSDIKSVYKAIYRERRKRHPTLPKSRDDVHISLSNMAIETSKSDSFLLVNDSDNGIVIFTCRANLECLCLVDELFMDGTFRCCPRFFTQLYTIHGYMNGNYIPLVFILLPGKSELIYRSAFSSLLTMCTERGFLLTPSVIHVDFEDTVMKMVHTIFPTTSVKCCRFHLGQSWWRKIQALGLSNEYKDKECEIGKWLVKVFGLPFLPSDQIEEAFAEDVMSDAPTDSRCVQFADYLTDVYVTHESRFPPDVWSEPPSLAKRTTNGPESFHSHYNAQFYTSHPSIFVFLDVILQIQTLTYIKIRNISSIMPLSRCEQQKLNYLLELWDKFQSGEISRERYIKSVGYKYQARMDL